MDTENGGADTEQWKRIATFIAGKISGRIPANLHFAEYHLSEEDHGDLKEQLAETQRKLSALEEKEQREVDRERLESEFDVLRLRLEEEETIHEGAGYLGMTVSAFKEDKAANLRAFKELKEKVMRGAGILGISVEEFAADTKTNLKRAEEYQLHQEKEAKKRRLQEFRKEEQKKRESQKRTLEAERKRQEQRRKRAHIASSAKILGMTIDEFMSNISANLRKAEALRLAMRQEAEEARQKEKQHELEKQRNAKRKTFWIIVLLYGILVGATVSVIYGVVIPSLPKIIDVSLELLTVAATFITAVLLAVAIAAAVVAFFEARGFRRFIALAYCLVLAGGLYWLLT